jgi:general secretion pathway protein M
MSGPALLRRNLSISPTVAAMLYAAVLAALLWMIASTIADLLARREQYEGATAMLAQIEGRKAAVVRRGKNEIAAPSGSVFLEGATVTVAGAALLQRVAGAITRVGGNVLSTQVELQGEQSKVGFISVVASCEVDQVGLQQLAYDLEAGLPLLFIDQLVAQAPPAVASTGEGRLRVLLTVSGQWQGGK